jgi:hypothetical protein
MYDCAQKGGEISSAYGAGGLGGPSATSGGNTSAATNLGQHSFSPRWTRFEGGCATVPQKTPRNSERPLLPGGGWTSKKFQVGGRVFWSSRFRFLAINKRYRMRQSLLGLLLLGSLALAAHAALLPGQNRVMVLLDSVSQQSSYSRFFGSLRGMFPNRTFAFLPANSKPDFFRFFFFSCRTRLRALFLWCRRSDSHFERIWTIYV